MVFQADAADYTQMKAVIKEIVSAYGTINGIIHAAGVPDGGVIQAKTREDIEAVMAPKIKGTLVLDALLTGMSGDFTPDFFVLCSSITAVLGAFGQVAYTAANVFLDHFAYHKNIPQTKVFRGVQGGGFSKKPPCPPEVGPKVISINWDAWQEVGMAVKAETRLQSRELEHPLFRDCRVKQAGQVVFTSFFCVKDFWVLDEHRLMGKPILPGTAYLEMARAALEYYSGSTAVEIREIYFLAPLVVEENEEKEIRTVLQKQEETGIIEFSITGREKSSPQWQEHARGKMVSLSPPEPEEIPHVDPAQLNAGCKEDPQAVFESTTANLGPRWSNIKSVKYCWNCPKFLPRKFPHTNCTPHSWTMQFRTWMNGSKGAAIMYPFLIEE